MTEEPKETSWAETIQELEMNALAIEGMFRKCIELDRPLPADLLPGLAETMAGFVQVLGHLEKDLVANGL